MLDLLGIVFSSIMMFLVILRAIQQDNLQPWFRSPRETVDDSGLKLRPRNPQIQTRDAVQRRPPRQRQ